MPSSRPEMGSGQILDALTAHIALYHSSSRPPPSNPNPRKTILRWFSSLSVHQRQASLTVVDPDFAKILLQMLARLETNGHGFFFLLPDLPSAADPTLPSLCYRPSRGLLSRASASNELERLISSAVRLFGSREGEPGAEYALDSMTVSEDLVKDAEQFVAAMDGISDGGFLREARSNVSQVPWEELEWLKGKGYYSVEAFLANRLELALRLSWLDCHGGKKQRVVKSKDKIGVAAIAANVFRRKMGCLDWWLGLDPGTRRKIILNCLCKGAKSLVKEMIEGQTALNNASVFLRVGSKLPVRYGSFPPCQRVRELCGSIDPEFLLGLMPLTLHKKPCRLANPLNHLLVLREVCDIVLASQHVEFEKETLIFSTLGSVHCISDCMLRRVRGILMSLSSECIKVELMEDSRLKMPLSKTEVNSAQGCRKGKKKGCNSKRLNSTTNLSRDHGRGSAYMENCISKATPWGNIPTAKASGKKKPVGTSAPESSLSKEAFVTQVGVEHAVVGDHEVNMRKKGKRKGAKNKRACWNENLAIENSVYNPTESSTPSSILHDGVENSMQSSDSLASGTTSVSLLVNSNVEPYSGYQNAANKTPLDSETGMQATQADVLHSTDYATCPECPQNLNKLESNDALENFSPNPLKDQGLPHELTSLGPVLNSDTSCSETTAISVTTFVREASDGILGSKIVESSRPEREHSAFCREHEVEHHSSKLIIDSASRLFQNDASNEHEANQREGSECNVHSQASFIGVASYEWPSISSVHFSSSHSQHLPPATDRLHLDVGHNVRNNIFQSSVSATANHQAINASAEGGCRRVIPCITSPMSSDWPPMVRSCGRFSQSVSLNLDTLYNSRLQSPFCTGLNARKMQITGSDNERKCSGDILDLCDFKNALEAVDDAESYWMSEDESDMPTFSGRDYNQFFGGGVMYWNTSDHVGASFSHPPSYSSEDSSWAWHEADLNKAIDDMVGMSGLSGSHSTSGVASPPAAPFCSPFDNLGPGKQSLGLAFPGNDASGLQSPSSMAEIPEGKIVVSLNNSASGSEGVKGDSLPYPVLPPIIIPSISRKGSRSEFMLSQDHKSPRVPSTRRDFPRIKRPPSPVVLCVPRAPRPPPPSPVGESRKHRGFPVVRSGSSSPRNWGMRSWHHEEHTSARAHICLDGAEVVWASLENRKHAGAPLMQPVPGSLLQDRLIAISQLSRDQEHPDAAFPVQPAEVDCPSRKVSLSMMHGILHEEIDCFCKKVAAENLIRKPYINWAVKRVAKSLQVLWPRSRTSVFGSNATGLSLPSSDVDLVVCLPPVRNLEPIKEAGILEGRNGIKETCLQHAARYLGNQEWVKNDSLKTIENTAIPLIMLIAEVPHDVIDSNGIASVAHTPEVQSDLINNVPNNLSHLGPCGTEGLPLPNFSKTIIDNSPNGKSIHLDISFKSPTHTGLQTTKLVRELTEQFPASIPLALVLKQFLADRSLDRSYSGGLSSYCLVLLIIRFLQHELHLGRPNSQNFGSLLMDFLYFFGNVFDPRQMRISIQGSGIYMNREKGHSIDPIHIDDPLCPTNNVGKNCFRIHQCIKAFADAYSVMDTQLLSFSGDSDLNMHAPFKLLQKIIPSIDYK